LVTLKLPGKRAIFDFEVYEIGMLYLPKFLEFLNVS
jgi:hypothetical protein